MRFRLPHILRTETLPELDWLSEIVKNLGSMARVTTLAEVECDGKTFPIHKVVLGSSNPEDPSIAFVGGVHGLERIGSQVVLSYMDSLSEVLRWDTDLRKTLERSRIVFMPIVNPIGEYLGRRSNGNGVDIMRNAPVGGEEQSWHIYRGHRFTSALPFYRGSVNSEMEIETKALCQLIEEELMPSKLSLAVDVHSGFGASDRFWFPYSHKPDVFEKISEVYSLKTLFEETYPHHFYLIEPVTSQYTIRGDPWDFMLEKQIKEHPQRLFIPFTLEMGSWLWLRKNPAQILSRFGLHNPVKPHRLKRILRRHLTLFNFLHRAILFPEAWAQMTDIQRSELNQKAIEEWYKNSPA